jgi:hypothetical protein
MTTSPVNMRIQNDHSELENWIPYKLVTGNGQVQCHWLNTAGKKFTEPFFDETILKCKSVNRRYSVFSSISDLLMMSEWGGSLDEVEPTAFIFHVSRCGSTLVSQMLAASNENIVLSEVPFFDDLLRLPYKDDSFDEADINKLLAAAITYYGQRRRDQECAIGEKEQSLFIKADSWHLFFYEQLRQLYPSVPFVIIYRRPDEVFRSQSKVPGMHSVPGLIEPAVFGFTAEDLAYKGPGIYLASVLDRYFMQCIKIAETDDKLLLLNYNEGPMQMIEKIAAFTNTLLSGEDLSKMKERSLYHSKQPGERFREDTINDIPDCLDKAMELYRTLDAKRIVVYS